MVLNLSVWDANGATFVAAHSRTDLLTAIDGSGRMVAVSLSAPQSRSEYGEGGSFVAMLGPLGLTLHDKTSGPMRQDDSGFGLVAMLAPRAGATFRDPFKIGLTNGEDGAFWLGKHSDRDGAGVDATVLLVGRDALPPMATGFVGEQVARSGAGDLKGNGTGAFVEDLDAKDGDTDSVSDKGVSAR